MTLPLEVDIDEVVKSRPGDEIFKEVLPYIEAVKEKSKEYQDKILTFILRDLYIDLAMSTAVDNAGAVVEYLVQDLGIEKPEFEGGALLRNLQRVSKLKTVMDFGRLLEMSDSELDAVLKEEVNRLWFDPARAAIQDKGRTHAPPATVSVPDDILQAIRGLIKVGKGKK